MTYRERRARKADRLRGWADKRDDASESARSRVDTISGMIPMGQPILVGHHSQRRAERDQERIVNGMRATIDNARKAEQFRGRADNIDAAAERAIYSDDPDAIEKLRAKLAKLEAQRENAKARNAEYWREHKAEKATLTAYQRDRAQPFPSYYGRNLSGVISSTRKRLAALQA